MHVLSLYLIQGQSFGLVQTWNFVRNMSRCLNQRCQEDKMKYKKFSSKHVTVGIKSCFLLHCCWALVCQLVSRCTTYTRNKSNQFVNGCTDGKQKCQIYPPFGLAISPFPQPPPPPPSLRCLPVINDVILCPAINVTQSVFTRNSCGQLAARKRKRAMFKK